jgi:hypothetical protein
VTPNDFRRIALAMNGAVEGSHMAHPDFRANGRIFATIYPDNERGMVQLTPDEQQVFMRDHAGVFGPASGAWGRGGSTTVQLARVDAETLGDAMTLAWQATVEKAAKKAAKQPVRKRGTVKAAAARTATKAKPRRKKG